MNQRWKIYLRALFKLVLLTAKNKSKYALTLTLKDFLCLLLLLLIKRLSIVQTHPGPNSLL